MGERNGRARMIWTGVAMGLSVLMLAIAPAAASAREARGHAAIVGGTTLLSVNQVPWTVWIFADDGYGTWSCTGVILDATHVLTAGHCLYDDSTGAVASPDDYTVFAGVTNLGDISPETLSAGVQSLAVDPGYDPYGTGNATRYDAYDIGVLTLATPLTFGADGSAPQPIAIGTPADAARAASLSVSGYGDETAGADNGVTQEDGTLNELTVQPLAVGDCSVDVDALVGCASSQVGSICYGDSGAAITSTGQPPVLLGITDAFGFVGDQTCEPSATIFYAKVTTPELSDFITGQPIVAAPQGGDDIGCIVPSPFTVGGELQCQPGSWTGSPTYTYTFIDDTTGAILQTGSPDFTLTNATIGHQIYFEVTASNAGGSAEVRTTDTSPVQPPPVIVSVVGTTSTPASAGGGSAPVGSSTSSTSSTSSATGAGSVAATTTTIRRQPPAVVPAQLRLLAASSSVAPGSKDVIRAVLSSGTEPARAARVCVTVPPGASVAQAAGATIRGRQACWVKTLRAQSSVTLTLREGVPARAKAATITTTATASGGLLAAVRIRVK